ncbi:MAG TPA: hypothetical protein DCR40_15010, partial [Prolixibacteraceae bacterium]|nr:hypothetical protein [Prolixibacteraceae bacterium]
MVWIGIVNSKTNKIDVVASGGITDEFLSKINIDLNDEKQSNDPTAKVINTGQYFIADDFLNCSETHPLNEDALQLGYQSFASFPLIVFEEIYGVMNFYSNAKRLFFDEEIKLLERMSMDISFAIEFIQNEARRREAEHAQYEANEYLENLFKYANAPVIVWDTLYRITRFNPAFEILTGRSAKDVIGQTLEILFPPENIESSMELINKAQQGERWKTVEINILHAEGYVRVVLWNSASVFDADGETLVATIAQGQDITERKRAEEGLQATEKRFRSLIEKSSDVIILINSCGIIMYESPSAMRILGYDDKELKGRNAFELVHPDDLQETSALFAKLVQTPGDIVNVQFRICHKDGSWRFLDAIGTNMLSDPDLQAIIINYRDITEYKYFEKELISAKERAEE